MQFMNVILLGYILNVQKEGVANNDGITFIKVQPSIIRWPCVHQVYSVVQYGLRPNRNTMDGTSKTVL
jgi:hypothetical protein